MERAAWTDERLDDLAEAMRTGFSRMDEDLRGLRVEVGSLRGDIRAEIGSLRGETRDEAGSIRGEIHALRGETRDESASIRGEIGSLRAEMNTGFAAVNSKIDRFGGGLIIALVGVIAAILARGV